MSSLRKDARELLRNALRRLSNGKSWTKGYFYRNGCYCSVGAVRSCLPNARAPFSGLGNELGPVYERAIKELARHSKPVFPLTKENYQAIVVWENDDSKSFKPIEKLFKRAIRSLR